MCLLDSIHNVLKRFLSKKVYSQHLLGAEVNLSDVNGNTALHLASAIPSTDACYLLLDSNANVNCKNKVGSIV